MNSLHKLLAVATAATATLAAAPTAAHAIVNGTPVTDAATAPWVATLDAAGSSWAAGTLLDRATCGGALIAPDRVVTAAHCVEDIDPSALTVHLNSRVLSTDSGEVRGVRAVAEVPGFAILPTPAAPRNEDDSSASDDLALILLDRPVTDLPVLPLADRRPTPGTPISYFAHGLTGKPVPPSDPGYRDDALSRGDLVVIPHRECAADTPATVDDGSVVCAKDPTTRGVAGCFRDSGSPAVATVDGKPELVGVYSFGAETLGGGGCASGHFDAFADPVGFRDWLRGPLADREPYPAGPPVVRRTGDTLSCAAPAWDTARGALPQRTSFGWATLERVGPYVVAQPIAGADAATYRPTGPSTHLICIVDARNAGGHITTRSVDNG